MEKRQRFTAEFKREAVRLLRTAGKPAAVVARGLGIPRNRLYKWAQDAEQKGDQAFPRQRQAQVRQRRIGGNKKGVRFIFIVADVIQRPHNLSQPAPSCAVVHVA